MTDELERRSGASPSGIFVLLFLAGLAFATAVAEYVYASDYAKAGMHPPVVHSRAGRVEMRRTAIGRVAERVQPRAGVWGATAVFAVPGVLFLAGAIWMIRRRRTPAAGTGYSS
jgi:hypothetical protein